MTERHSESLGGSRRLLKLLRDQMKGKGSNQDHLNQIVELIAQDFEAEVCSIYVMRKDQVLELVATKGLKREAVHKTTLRKGEGIVGLVAEQAIPLAVTDAPHHPNFAFRPETGEEPYQSMLGVPIMRNGQVLGIIAVQNLLHRQYEEDEVEALETVAMVLAELVSSEDLVFQEDSEDANKPDRIVGLCLTSGLAVAPAVMHNRGIVISRMTCEDPDAEVNRLLKNVTEMRGSIDDMLERTEIAALGEQREVLETYRMFAADRGWIGRIADAIRNHNLSAEAAVQRAQEDTRKRMSQISDPYLRERLADLDDLSNRLLGHLLGSVHLEKDLPEQFVLVARTMGPAELLDYKGKKLRGVVLEEGSPTAHVALVAQALEIPVLGQCRGVLERVREGDVLVVDAEHDQVLIRPAEAVAESFRSSFKGRRQRWAEISAERELPPVTKDGCRISLNCNAGLLVDLPNVVNSGADGVGLYRTEVPFMVRQSLPGIGEQAELYRKIYSGVEDRRVVFRTLDVGGDKVLPYWSMAAEENPAMGWRAIRIGLDRPALLRQQLRALIRASAGRELSVMFPMVADLSEYRAARDLLEFELNREASIGGELPVSLRLGAMLEVPSLVWQLPEICPHLDFLSIGSNDLLQFFFAADRGNTHLSRRYDTLSLSVIRMLRQIARVCHSNGVDVTVCGDMASHPLEAMALLASGYRSLSMPPLQVAAVKTMVRTLDLETASDFLDNLVLEGTADIRAGLEGYAERFGVNISGR